MAAYAFDNRYDLDELQNVIDRGSSAGTTITATSVAQRQANALCNLGLNAGTPASPGYLGTTSGTLLTKGAPLAGQVVVVAANGTLTLPGGLTVTTGGLTVTAGSTTLPAGTATVAPLLLTAGTNLTTPAAGAVEFDGSNFYATAVASARQAVDAEQYMILASDYALTNGTSAQQALNGTAAGALTLTAGKQYAFEAQYIITNTGTTSHTWSVLFGGTATLTSIAYTVYATDLTSSTPATGGLSGWANVATAIVVSPASTSATENLVVNLQGVLTINAGGTFIPQVKLSAAPGGAQAMKAGSFFRVWELNPAYVGNWS